MSYWTFISGVITVESLGRTTAETRYITETVLNHLPKVTGAECNMKVFIQQSYYERVSDDVDDFGQRSNNMEDGVHTVYSGYHLVVEGHLRDRRFEQTKREFLNWLCRLSKRIGILDICVKITEDDRQLILTDPRPFAGMFEIPPWVIKIGGKDWYHHVLGWIPGWEDCNEQSK